MNDFKVGHRVWDMRYGHGRVFHIYSNDESEYSVSVKFDAAENATFTKDGREYLGLERTLFFKQIPIPADALIPPVEEIVLKKGDIVLFKNGQLRYVASDSGSDSTLLTCHDNVPQNLDSAFDYSTALKQNIKKVVGNIND